MTHKCSESDRRLRQSYRVARVLRFLQFVQSRGRWNACTLAAELECSERTIYRDKEVLELAGIPCDHNKAENAYRLAPHFRFPVLQLTEEEAMGQAAATIVAETPNLKPGVGSKPTTQKIAASSSPSVQQMLADAAELVAVLDLKLADHSGCQETIRTVQRALLQRKQLSGVYRSPYQEGPVLLQLHPYRLCFLKQAWYLIARNDGEDQPFTYRLPRFEPGVRVLEAAATTPADFDLRAYFGNAWSVYRGDPSYKIEILFSREAAVTVVETVWHHTQKVRRHRDGTATLTFQVDGLNEIIRWVLGWAGRATVVKPPELRTLVVQQFKTALQMHES